MRSLLAIPAATLIILGAASHSLRVQTQHLERFENSCRDGRQLRQHRSLNRDDSPRKRARGRKRHRLGEQRISNETPNAYRHHRARKRNPR